MPQTELTSLNADELRTLYQTLIVPSFPPDETRSLSSILKAMGKGQYVAYGSKTDGRYVGCAFLIRLDGDYLLDYLVTAPDVRGKGCGAALLSLLKERLDGASSLIAEVEAPETTNDPSEAALRTRRIGFYLRCGFVLTEVNVSAFGVAYRLIELPFDRSHTPDEIRELYRAHYRAVLPPILYRTMIRV